MIVVDTNIISYLLLPTPCQQAAEALFQEDTVWASPLLWRSEMRNVLALYLRKELISLDQEKQIQDRAEVRMRGWEYQVPSDSVLTLAAVSGCSAYDCEFVALAQDLGVPLVTMDRALRRAFPHITKALS